MLNNKTIIICGAAGIIGSEIAKVLSKNKAKLILVDKNKKKLEILRKKFQLERKQVINLNLTSQSNIKKLIKYSKFKFGKIDAAINCFYPKSSMWGKSFIDVKEKFLFQDLNNQLGATIFFSTEFTKFFSNQKKGNLILFSSIQGFRAPKFEHYEGTPMISPIEYSAVKSGIIAITRWLAKHYRQQNIRVNCISPGGIMDQQPESFLKRYQTSCNSKGMLDPEDICGALIFLLSEQSQFVTGQNLIIDDGWSL